MSSSLTNSAALRPFGDEDGAGRTLVSLARVGAGSSSAGDGADVSGGRLARKRSTIEAISSRLTFGAPPPREVGAAAAALLACRGRCRIAVTCAATAGRLLATARVSNT